MSVIHRVALSLVLLVSLVIAKEPPVAGIRLPPCQAPPKGQKLIGWGKQGLFFSVPMRGVKILGGKPDVDYVKFIIKPNRHESALVLWFGGMAFDPRPPGEIVRTSEGFIQTKLLSPDGAEIGLDSRGKKHDMSRWRWFGIWSEGGNTRTPRPRTLCSSIRS